MLCGNKTDLRRGLGNSGGCVTTKDGEEVAEVRSPFAVGYFGERNFGFT